MQTPAIQLVYADINGTVAKSCHTFPAIAHETRSHVSTACAAFWLNRKPQTLRAWASYDNGPIRPTRINGRLAWPVSQIRSILNGDVV